MKKLSKTLSMMARTISFIDINCCTYDTVVITETDFSDITNIMIEEMLDIQDNPMSIEFASNSDVLINDVLIYLCGKINKAIEKEELINKVCMILGDFFTSFTSYADINPDTILYSIRNNESTYVL